MTTPVRSRPPRRSSGRGLGVFLGALVLAALIKETEALGPVSMMQIAPEQGAFMTILTRAVGARSAVRFRDVHGLKLVPDQGVMRFLRELGELIDLRRVRGDLVVSEPAHRLAFGIGPDGDLGERKWPETR
jgi:hypothetical protein